MRRAFSLVELACVIVIIGVLSAIVLPHWTSASQDYRANLAAQRIAGDLAFAQSRANYSSTSVTITFNPAANTYQIVGYPDPDRPWQTYTVILSADPYNAALTSATFGASSQLTFDGYGTPGSGGTLVVTSGPFQRTITVDASSGRASIQ